MKVMVKKSLIAFICALFFVSVIHMPIIATSESTHDDSWLIDFYENEEEREKKEKEEKNKNNMQSDLTEKDKYALITSRNRVNEAAAKVRTAILIGGLVIFGGMLIAIALILYRKKLKENEKEVFKAQTERKGPVMHEIPKFDEDEEEVIRMSKEFDKEYERENRNENKYLNDYDN